MRFQLATLNDTRDDSRERDSWGINCFVEKEEELRAVKRPGLVSTFDAVGAGTIGQGLFIWPTLNGPKIITIWDDFLWVFEFDYTLDFIWDLSTAGIGGSGTDSSSGTWRSGQSYDYDEPILYDDGTGTLVRFYATSPNGSPLKSPTTVGWEQYLWSQTPLNTTDRWLNPGVAHPFSGQGNTANAAGAATLAMGVPDVFGAPSFPTSGVDGLGRNWTEGIASTNMLPLGYESIIIFQPNPPHPGGTVTVPRALGAYEQIA